MRIVHHIYVCTFVALIRVILGGIRYRIVLCEVKRFIRRSQIVEITSLLSSVRYVRVIRKSKTENSEQFGKWTCSQLYIVCVSAIAMDIHFLLRILFLMGKSQPEFDKIKITGTYGQRKWI